MSTPVDEPGVGLIFEWHSADPDERDYVAAYWERSGDSWAYKVADVADVAGWQRHEVAGRVAAIATVRRADAGCPRCGEGPVASSRSAYDAHTGRRMSYPCSKCREAEAAERAEVQRVAAAEAAERKRQLSTDVAEAFALVDRDPLEIDELSFEDAVLLFALLGDPIDEQYVRSRPLRDWSDPPFAPARFEARERLLSLWRRGFLVVHPSSSPEAFGYTQDGSVGVYEDRISFTAPGVGPTGPVNADLVRRLRAALAGDWPGHWDVDALRLYDEVMLSEAIDYLDLCLETHRMSFSPGEKTRQVLGEALQHWPLGGVYNLIWRAARDAAAYHQTGVPLQQATNSVITRIEGAELRARNQGWDLTCYRRDRRLPWSRLSQTVFQEAFRVGDAMATPRDVAASRESAGSAQL